MYIHILMVHHCSHFEKIALGVLSECYSSDEQKAKMLLIRQLPSYGNATILQLAVEGTNKEFISHQACQQLLNNIWYGKLDELSCTWYKVSTDYINQWVFHYLVFMTEWYY